MEEERERELGDLLFSLLPYCQGGWAPRPKEKHKLNRFRYGMRILRTSNDANKESRISEIILSVYFNFHIEVSILSTCHFLKLMPTTIKKNSDSEREREGVESFDNQWRMTAQSVRKLDKAWVWYGKPILVIHRSLGKKRDEPVNKDLSATNHPLSCQAVAVHAAIIATDSEK